MVEMQSVVVGAGDYSMRVYRFVFTERLEWRLYREFNGCRSLIPMISDLEHVISVGFGSSENGFSLTLKLKPSLEPEELRRLDGLVEAAIGDATETLMQRHLSEMTHALEREHIETGLV